MAKRTSPVARENSKGTAAGCALLAVGLAWFGWSGTAQADLLHLKSGSVVDIGWDYRVEDGKIHVVRGSGAIAFSMADVERIVKKERPKEDVKSPPKPPPAAIAERTETPGAGRDDLLGVLDDAIALVRDVGTDETPSPEDRQARRRRADSWIQRVETIQAETQKTEPRAPAIETAAEDLVRTLWDLRDALDQGNAEGVRSAEGNFSQIREKLEAAGQ
jgi:hypothetical protein